MAVPPSSLKTERRCRLRIYAPAVTRMWPDEVNASLALGLSAFVSLEFVGAVQVERGIGPSRRPHAGMRSSRLLIHVRVVTEKRLYEA